MSLYAMLKGLCEMLSPGMMHDSLLDHHWSLVCVGNEQPRGATTIHLFESMAVTHPHPDGVHEEVSLLYAFA